MTVRAAFPIAAAATALLFVLMALQARPLDPPVPAIQLTYRAEAFHGILAQWGAAGIARFRAHLVIDYAFLAAYGVFGYLFAARFGPAPARRVFAGLLPAAAAMDALENALHLCFVRAEAALWGPLYALAGVVATAKWCLILAFAVLAAARVAAQSRA